MKDYSKRLLVFAKGADFLECVGAHFLPEHSGVCDLSGDKEQNEIFVLANRAGATMKVSKDSLDIVANVLDIQNTNQWFGRLKEQKKAHKAKLEEQKQLLDEKKRASRVVLRRKSSL
ncbi:hypothetical protein GW915_08740 [bacterium]|nr:hypothetical protein [bacterium]